MSHRMPRRILPHRTGIRMGIAMVVAPAAVLGTVLVSGGTAEATTTPHNWIIDQPQLRSLSSWYQYRVTKKPSITLARTVAEIPKVNAAHYTAVGACPDPMMPHCLSMASPKSYTLHQAPLTDPLPASPYYAMIDLEPFGLTPYDEYATAGDRCQTVRQAAALVGSVGALLTPTSTPPFCSARAAGRAGIVAVGCQPLEMNLYKYRRCIIRARNSARLAVPGIKIAYGVSTNPKYRPTVRGLYRAWKLGRKLLGWRAYCWLNIIPAWSNWPSSKTAAAMAMKFLKMAYG